MSESKCEVCGMESKHHGQTCTAGGSFPAPAGSVPTMREILDAIECEPELPGNIPEEMFEVIREDRNAMAETIRIAVRQTKANILKRVAKLGRDI